MAGDGRMARRRYNSTYITVLHPMNKGYLYQTAMAAARVALRLLQRRAVGRFELHERLGKGRQDHGRACPPEALLLLHWSTAIGRRGQGVFE